MVRLKEPTTKLICSLFNPLCLPNETCRLVYPFSQLAVAVSRVLRIDVTMLKACIRDYYKQLIIKPQIA